MIGSATTVGCVPAILLMAPDRSRGSPYPPDYDRQEILRVRLLARCSADDQWGVIAPPIHWVVGCSIWVSRNDAGAGMRQSTYCSLRPTRSRGPKPPSATSCAATVAGFERDERCRGADRAGQIADATDHRGELRGDVRDHNRGRVPCLEPITFVRR